MRPFLVVASIILAGLFTLASCGKQYSPYEVRTHQILSKFTAAYTVFMEKYHAKKTLLGKADCMRDLAGYSRSLIRTMVVDSEVPQKYRATNKALLKVLMRHEEIAIVEDNLLITHGSFDREREKATAAMLLVTSEFYRLRDGR